MKFSVGQKVYINKCIINQGNLIIDGIVVIDAPMGSTGTVIGHVYIDDKVTLIRVRIDHFGGYSVDDAPDDYREQYYSQCETLSHRDEVLVEDYNLKLLK
jgi:hypothetical protein